MVTTEWNVYYNEACTSVDCLEGEDWEFIEMTMDVPQTQIQNHPPCILGTLPHSHHKLLPCCLVLKAQIPQMVKPWLRKVLLEGAFDDPHSMCVILLKGME